MNASKALHAVLASSALGVIADALTQLHGAAQAGSLTAALAALAVSAVSAAAHSRAVQRFAHQIDLDASKVVTPAVVARVQAVEKAAAQIVPVGDVEKLVDAAVAKVKGEIPAVAKPAVEDVRPLVAEVLGPLAALLPKDAPAAPPAAPAPVAPAETAPPTS